MNSIHLQVLDIDVINKYGFHKCTCIKTHNSGASLFEENEIYFYISGNRNSDYYTVLTHKPLFKTYTYLSNDFKEHFVDTASSRHDRIETLFDSL